MIRRVARIALVAASACRPVAPVPAAPPTGRWIDGDIHVHATGGSNDTDALSYPKDIAEVARARGLDFIVLTDHSNATGSMSFGDDVENHPNLGPEFPYREAAASLTVPGELVMVVGNEVSPVADLTAPGPPRGHVGCLPGAGDPFARVPASFAFVDRPPGAVKGGAGVVACHAIGGFAVVNHPYAVIPWVAYDWSSTEYDALEVWNGGMGFDAWDLKGMQAWWCDRSLGRSVAPVGGSDCHRVRTEPPGTLTDPYLGAARTLVFVSELTPDALARGLAAGRTVAHDAAARLEVWASAEGRGEPLLPGDRLALAGGTTLTFHVRGRADRSAQVQILSVGAGECADHRGEGNQGEAVVSPRRDAFAPVAAADFELAIPVAAEPGRDYAVRLWHSIGSDGFEAGLALSNAIRVTGRP